MVAINSVVEDQSEFVEAFRENVIRVIGSYQTVGEATQSAMNSLKACSGK